jgi:2',3'-cyclic-nucleotide 2'-phosphodiesterase (5'-nucleotidase family)
MAPTKLSLAALAAAAFHITAACPDGEHAHDGAHVHKRAFPQAPLTPPSHPLEWGDINIIHTTESHGWLLGHQKTSFPEPNYRCAACRRQHCVANANSV